MDDQYLNSLLNKFWNGTASNSEKLILYDFLKELDNEARAEQYIEHSPSENELHLLKDDRKKILLKALNDEIRKRNNEYTFVRILTKYRRMITLGAAAAVILAFLLTHPLSKNNVKATNNLTIATKYETIFNNLMNIKPITLPDRSTVLLYPKSSICFEKAFQKRAIRLNGKASFKVVHDAENTFSVATGDIITTDIGTEFEIDALKKSHVVIHLLEGKIKVGKTQGSTMNMKDQLLNAGEVLSINTASGKFALAKSIIQKNTKRIIYDKPIIFDKTPLERVFTKISKKYDTKIIFNTADISKLSFTGTIEPNDSLSTILNIICYMNNLHCSAAQPGYIITR